MNIEDNGCQHKKYIQRNLSEAWQQLRAVQKNSKHIREVHMKELADHFAIRRKTSRIQELKNIRQSERTRKIAAKTQMVLKRATRYDQEYIGS